MLKATLTSKNNRIERIIVIVDGFLRISVTTWQRLTSMTWLPTSTQMAAVGSTTMVRY